jgi:thymidylate synthase (FAD)
VFSLRCSKAAHPQIRELMKMGLRTFTYSFPVVFDDLFEEHIVDSEEEKSKRQIVMEQLLKGDG